MIAKVFVVSDLKQRIELLGEEMKRVQMDRNHPDVLYIDAEQKMGIEQSRNIKDFFTLMPYQAKGRAVIVEDLSGITPEAQNALLKLLEEPPESAVILLGTPFIHHLLPTVLSRVQVVNDGGEKQGSRISGASRFALESGMTSDVEEYAVVEKILTSAIEERFKIVEKTTDKKDLLHKLLKYSEKRIARDPSFHKVAKDILRAEEWWNANVNMRGILEYLMLIIPKKHKV